MSQVGTYRIEYYQVNIGVGDCEILLLVKETGFTKEIEKAVIIDGGQDAGRITNIKHTIQSIEAEYKPNGGLKFDAVVITHWHRDHYTGTLRMMIDDLEIRRAEDPNGTTELQVSFLKYVDADPVSILYIPYPLELKAFPLEGVGVTRPIRYSEDGKEFGFGDSRGGKKGNGKGMKRVAKVHADMEKLDLTRLDVSQTAKPFDSDHELSELIGRELFHGNREDGANSASGPAALLHAHKADIPGLFCVAVNHRYLPPPLSSTPKDNWERSAATRDDQYANFSSITCLVIWPNGCISHYLAGDAPSDIEAGVIEWTGLLPAEPPADIKQRPPRPPLQATIPVVKISHHGAPSSTPLNFYQSLKPSVILFSAGKSTHLHPDWSNLFYAYAYLASWRGLHASLKVNGNDDMGDDKVKVDEFEQAICLTCWPHYLFSLTRPIPPVVLIPPTATIAPDLIFPAASNPIELMLDPHSGGGPPSGGGGGVGTGGDGAHGSDGSQGSSGSQGGIKTHLYRDVLKSFFDGSDRSSDLVTQFQNARITTPEEAAPWVGLQLEDVVLKTYCCITRSATPTGISAREILDGGGISKFAATLQSQVSYIQVISRNQNVRPAVHVEPQNVSMYDPSKKANKVTMSNAEPDVQPLKKVKVEEEKSPASKGFALVALPIPAGNARRGYIMSSLVIPQDASRSVFVVNEWDGFVSALSAGFFTITDTLSSTTTSIEVDTSDEWLAWFTAALSPTEVNTNVRLFVSSSLVDSKAKIEHFDLLVPLPLLPDQDVSLSFGPSRKVGPNAELSPFDPFIHFLRFGMSNNSAKISLDNLLSFCDLSPDTVGFGSELAFQLDEENSAVWFSPLASNYSAAFRLQADAQPGDWSHIAEALKKFGLWDAVPTSITVVVKRDMLKLTSPDGIRCVKAPQLGISLSFSDFSAVVFCSPEGYTFTLRWKLGVLDAVKKLLKAIGSSDLVSTFEQVLGTIGKFFDILRVTVKIQRTPTGFKIVMLSVDAQVTLKFGNSGDAEASTLGNSGVVEEVVFLLSFLWPRKFFRGSLYIPDARDDSWRKLMPDYEEFLEIAPITHPSSKIRTKLAILDLIPGVTIEHPPKGIPTEATQATLEVDGSRLSFSAVLVSSDPPESAVPPISFDSIELAMSYNWDAKDPASRDFAIYIAVVISLHPSPSTNPADQPNLDPRLLHASVNYESGLWTLTGTLSNINFGDLLTFFKTEERSQIKDILGNITITSLSLTYEYIDQMPSKFQFDGSISIAELELDLMYTRDANGWQVKAALSASKPCTLSDVMSSVCGNDAQAFEFPGFIGDIKLNISHDGGKPSNWKDSPVYLSCSKPTSPGSPLIFALQLTLGEMRITFLQLSYSIPADGTVKKMPKRVLLFTFTHVLPSLEVPVVGTLENPVDGLQFLWVHDGNATAGLTRAEVAEINDTVFAPGIGVLFKESKTILVAADIVVVAGCHFVLLVNDGGQVKAALDYKFAAGKKKPSVPVAMASFKAEDASDPSSQTQDAFPGGVSKAAVHKVVGPLSLSNIGLQYNSKDNKLFIVLDATLALGPISLSLLGFGLGAKLSADFFTHFNLDNFGLELHGLAVALDQPPMLLAGLFEDLSTPTMELFTGGVAVSMKQYSFLAFGSYGVIEDQSKKYKTFFFFAQLQGPLIELEFATINGVTLGFGYNSHLKYPTVDDVLDFPLVKGISTGSAGAATSSSNVLTILSDAVFTTWVNPQDGSLWFAAGLEALAFKTLDIRAVAVVEIDPYVTLGLFADAVLSLPPSQPRDRCFTYVELGITCRVDIKNGSFSVEGKLSPNSFVLHPSCHLLGGFAMYYWFDPSPYAGDFVFSIGGYHPAYRPPSYYPQPQRLSISWQLDSHIGITGEAYFAVCPKVCMGGGSLSIVFSAGPLGAHLDAYADFLMVWNPFHFIGNISVSIGVSFHVKILFINVHISVDIGGSLHLEGPPFGGNVHVNFYFFGFDIYFGSHPGPPPALTLNEFWDLLSRSSNQQDSGNDIGITLVVQSGYAPGQNKDVTPPPQTPWLVIGGLFKFLIQCRFALKTVRYETDTVCTDVLSGKIPLYSKPMHSTEPIRSTLQVTITKRETLTVVDGFTFKPMLKNVPSAQWGQYVAGEDPSQGSTSSSLLDGSNSTLNEMLMGAMIAAPLPEFPDDGIPPYKAHDAMFMDIIKGEAFPPGDPSPEASSWLPANTTSDKAMEAWSSPPTDPQNVVSSWVKAFQWKDKLVGVAPTFLLKNFKAVYLDIPSLTSA